MQGRSILKRLECAGVSDGKFFLPVCITGAWHAPVNMDKEKAV